ncbi:hypothetical protein Lnau_1835 [Legionella nautarum]|uniref:Uncharacterized protein n=1 Tax=Legionella nautarum TaxID=45070 RepID=A0A0W0WS80_9GAMM|nr:hypothetical protein [Legionella nautarum]KTD35164.1 hypothetical protein Lnau_1835 [Legionella nautarum]
MAKISELKRGDIILIRHNGKPYHVAIYAPNPEYIGDVIHMGTGFRRNGAIRSTLEYLYNLHAGLNATGNFFNLYSNTLDVQVIRSKTLDGEEIAQQAERWLLQGVIYDEKRLANTLEENETLPDTSPEAQTVNVFEYLKFAARRNTAPIKAPFFPYTMASFLSGFSSFLLAPSLNLPKWIMSLALTFIRYGTNYEGRAKGFNCAGFILAVVGAVALKDEIQELSPENGWVSLKYGSSPENKESNYANALKTVQEKKGVSEGLAPGLHTLLTEEQIQDFDIERLKTKLGGLALLHPHKPHLNSFTEQILQNEECWDDLGLLGEHELATEVSNLSKPFDKEEYRAEKKSDFQKTQENHQQFGVSYGNTAFAGKTYPLSFFKRAVSSISGEPISDISPKQTSTAMRIPVA